MGPDPTSVFEAERGRLTGIAYRMLGTPDDADDVVQETWLRWNRADHASVEEPAAWLTTVASRIAIDRLGSARVRRESYVGPWLPEPLVVDDADPATTVVSDESLTIGFLRVLETLAPVERAVFLLHDVFGYPLTQVAEIVERGDDATRKIASRARGRVRDGRPRVDVDPTDADRLLEAFGAALVEGDVDAFERLLADDVTHWSDGGAARHAARRPVVGAARVARLMINLTHRDLRPTDQIDWIRVNGQRAVYVRRAGEPFMLLLIAWRDGRVVETQSILEPAKLAAFHARWLARRTAP